MKKIKWKDYIHDAGLSHPCQHSTAWLIPCESYGERSLFIRVRELPLWLIKDLRQKNREENFSVEVSFGGGEDGHPSTYIRIETPFKARSMSDAKRKALSIVRRKLSLLIRKCRD